MTFLNDKSSKLIRLSYLTSLENIAQMRFRIDGEDIRIMLWDTAGQEEFDAITKAYYRGAQACVLAFSTTDRMSFEAVKDWKMKVLLWLWLLLNFIFL